MADIFLGGTIRPGTTDPVIDARDAIDGWRSVANAAARLALTAPYLRVGMIVVEQDTLDAYQLTVLSPVTWAPFSAGSGATFLWSAGKTWATLYAEIQAAGGFGTVWLERGAVTNITAGSWDTSRLDFRACSTIAVLTIDAGALLDGGPFLLLRLTDIILVVNDSITSPTNVKSARVVMQGGYIQYLHATNPMIYETAVQGVVFQLTDSGTFTTAGGPYARISAINSTVLFVRGSTTNTNPPNPPLVGLFDFTAAAIFTVYTDAENQHTVTPAIYTGSPGGFTRHRADLSLPPRTTAQLPVPSATNPGYAAWDTTKDRPVISNGAAYRNLAMQEGTYLWSAGKTWTQLWDEIQDGSGGFGTVYIPSGSLVTITGVGPYDLNGLKFVGLGARSELDFDPGVLVDAGATISLSFDNLLVFGQAPMMTPGAKRVAIQLYRSLFANFFGGAALFSTSDTQNEILAINSTVSCFADDGTDPLFNLTAPGARLINTAQGGGFDSQIPFIYSTNLFLGNAAASVATLVDALTMFDALKGTVGPIVESLGNQYGRLGLPNYTTAQLPTPSATRKGNVSFDTTANRPRYATATEIRSFNEGSYLWSLTKTWAQLWAEVQAGGGFGTIIVETDRFGTFRDVDIGSYDWTKIRFEGLPNSYGTTFGPLINLPAGVLLDAGDHVAIHGDQIVFLVFGTLMATGGSKRVVVDLSGGSRLFRVGDITIFDSSADDSYFNLLSSSIAGDGTTLPLFNLTSATAFCFVDILLNLSGVVIPDRCFGGVAGSSVGFSADNFGGSGLVSAALIAPTVAVTGQFVSFTWPTAFRPVMIPGFGKGTLGYNFSSQSYEHWDGTDWVPHLAEEQGAIKIANHTAKLNELVKCDPTAGGFTVTLPTVVGHTARITIKNKSGSANAILVAAAGGETIDGASPLSMVTPRQSVTLVSDGVSEWMVV